MAEKNYRLGCKESSEQLIKDLYLDLRDKIRRWAAITQQTAQARMGYVGQHLVSIVVSCQGSRSGARGKDLIISATEHGEIKTCYRVDQLGKCNDCNKPVASIEESCPLCGSKNLKRNDDSKWLIGIRNDDEFNELLLPQYYYLVLFDFVDIHSTNTDIQASIWRVDPKKPGFAFCMIDYYFNIRSKSTSKAPFNLWPYQYKFDIMSPLLIYRSIIKSDNTIDTQIFPGLKEPQEHKIHPLPEYSRANNLSKEKILKLGVSFGVKLSPSEPKDKLLVDLEKKRKEIKIKDSALADKLAEATYLEDIIPHKRNIPPVFKKIFPSLS
jgi:hypothetical protein